MRLDELAYYGGITEVYKPINYNNDETLTSITLFISGYKIFSL